MPLTKVQSRVANNDTRFRVFMGGRRVGKTVLGIREICKAAAEPNQMCWAVCPSYRQAKNVWWQPLKNKLIKLRWVKKINESELTISLVNGSTICLKGAENFDSLRGNKIHMLVLDEFADIKPQAFFESLRPMLSDTQGRALFLGTPKGRNWAYDLFNLEHVDPEWISFSATTLEGGNVPPEEIESARRQLDERTFQQEYEGSFVNYFGIIYNCFDREHNVKPWEQEQPKILHIGIDFNIDPMTATVFAREDDILHVVDEIRIFSSNTDELVDEIKSRYPNTKIFAYPDPAGRARKSSSNGKTDLYILQNAGFIVKAPSRHPAVRDRINSVNSRLCSSSGERRLFVDPKCRYTIESLERQTYKEGTTQPDKDSGYDHQNDSLGYCVHYLYPIRKDIGQQTIPQRWQHQIGA